MSRQVGAPRSVRNWSPPARSCGVAPDGTNALIAIAHESPVKLAGATPITVKARPLRTIARPTIPGSPPKRRCQ